MSLVDEAVIPVLRVESAATAVAWYERLGFAKRREHRFEPGFPAFVEVARGGVRLFPSEHEGDARPDTLVYLRVRDVDAVGHVRYPWIGSVAFRPRQSFLNDCELVVQGRQDSEEAAGGTAYYGLTMILDRGTDSGELAQRLVRRPAGHHLDHGMLPSSARPLFEALRDPPRLPAPDKGDHATYALPAFKSYPEGVEYLLDRPVGGTWTGPGRLSAD